EVLSSKELKIVHRLGPAYARSFQGPLSAHQTYELYDADNVLAVLEQQKTSASPLNPLALFASGSSPLGDLDLAATQFTLAEDRLLLALSARNVETRPPLLVSILLSAAPSFFFIQLTLLYSPTSPRQVWCSTWRP